MLVKRNKLGFPTFQGMVRDLYENVMKTLLPRNKYVCRPAEAIAGSSEELGLEWGTFCSPFSWWVSLASEELRPASQGERELQSERWRIKLLPRHLSDGNR